MCDRSKKDLRDRLIRKGYTESVAEDVSKEMESRGYINDRRFAERFTEDAVDRKGAGPGMIRVGLQRKGITPDIINDVVDKIFTGRRQADIARSALRRRLRNGAAPTDRNEIRRLSEYLRRRGFSYDIIRDALRGIEEDDDID